MIPIDLLCINSQFSRKQLASSIDRNNDVDDYSAAELNPCERSLVQKLLLKCH